APERSLWPPEQKQESTEPQAVLSADSLEMSQPAERLDSENAGRGELITAGSLRELDGTNTSESAVDEEVAASEPADTENTMPNYLARKEVSAVIRKLRQGASLWRRIQSVRVDEQRLEQVRDQMMSNQHLIR
ncbi:MAG TPA: hypothetical protein VHH13_06155, partial [Arthrobacter sp.]|nr:hypothetical protein [Arthrobacter sp.]